MQSVIQLLGDIRKIDKQVIINVDLYCRIKRVLKIEQIALEVINGHSFALGIDNPVFTHIGVFVVVQFADVIIGRIARGDNFNNKVGGAITPFPIQLVFIAHNHKIRLDYGKRIVA